MNGRHLIKLLELAPESVRNEIGLTANNRDEFAARFGNDTGVMTMALFYACRTITSVERAAPIIANLKISAMDIHALIAMAASEEFGETSALLDGIRKATASKKASAAVAVRHKNPDGKTQKASAAKEKIVAAWKSGKYTSRDVCAEQECGGLDISFSTARKALRNI
ncbi:MAG: hypothetical protein WA056_01665 [Gallionella sp.]